MLYFKNFVLTSEGYKNTSELNSKCFTFNRLGRHNRIIYTSDDKVSPTPFTAISTQVDQVPTLVRNNKKVFSVDLETFDKKYVLVEDLTQDHWLYTPWVLRDTSTAPRKSIDLAAYVDNHYDPYHLYLFNNEILDIASELNKPTRAIKELLIREAAEYDIHLNELRQYIEYRYGITEDLSDPETSFLNFKKFVLANHVFKMNRYIEMDEQFLSFLIAVLTRSKMLQNTFNKNNRYLIQLHFEESDKSLLQNVLAFLKKLNVKWTYEEDSNSVKVLNKPLYKLAADCLLKDISFLLRLEDHLYNFFVNTLFQNVPKLRLDLELLLQIKHIFLSNQKVVAIQDDPCGGYFAKLLTEDSFNTLEDVLIIESTGYYSKINDLNSTVYKGPYTHVVADDAEVLYLGFLLKD